MFPWKSDRAFGISDAGPLVFAPPPPLYNAMSNQPKFFRNGYRLCLPCLAPSDHVTKTIKFDSFAETKRLYLWQYLDTADKTRPHPDKKPDKDPKQ